MHFLRGVPHLTLDNNEKHPPMQRELSAMDSNSARDAREVLDRPEDIAQDRPNLFYEGIRYAPSLLPPTTFAQPLTFLHSRCRGNLPTSAPTSVLHRSPTPFGLLECGRSSRGSPSVLPHTPPTLLLPTS